MNISLMIFKLNWAETIVQEIIILILNTSHRITPS